MRIILVIILLPFFVSANKDSLLNILRTGKTDSVKIIAAYKITNFFEAQGNFDSCQTYMDKAYKLASVSGYKKGKGDYFNFAGRKHLYRQNYDSAMYYFAASAEAYLKVGFNKGYASARNNIAIVYSYKGETRKSMREYFDLIEFCTKNKLRKQLADGYSNVGYCYSTMTNFDSAAYYHIQSSKINEADSNYQNLLNNYLNLASASSNTQDHKKALRYIDLAREISKKIKMTKGSMVTMLSLRASIYRNLNQNDSAKIFYNMCIDTCRAMGDKGALVTSLFQRGDLAMIDKKPNDAFTDYSEALKIGLEADHKVTISNAYNHLARYYLELKKFEEAKKHFLLGHEVSIMIRDANDIISNLSGLAKTESALGNFKQATFFLDSLIRFKDFLSKEEKEQSTKELEARFQTEKRDMQLQRTNSELKATEADNKRKTVILIIGSVALLLTLFFALAAVINFRKAKKAGLKVKEQNQFLENQNIEIQKQRDLVEEKQKEIISSINYAQRIQSAVLTSDEVWKRISKEYFILFRPKDIVSGDFYWAHVLPNGRAVFAIADCTGHGVPGGFMSMLGNSFLNELVVENKIFNAATILNKLREKIIKALDQKGQSEQKDGMDIVLCVWNKMDNTLEFAGANNNLYIARDGKITVYKGNKMPIGTYINDKTEFTAQTIQLQKGDCMYASTDGFADQFGGPHGKKYKHKQLETVILAISDLPMDQQSEIMEKDLLEWKGKLEQVDDVCVLGIRV